MLGAGLLLGTLGVPLEEAAQHPLTAVWFRCAFATVALSLVLAVRGEWRELLIRGRSFGCAVASALLMLLNWWLFFESIRRTSIALATLVFHLQPFMVMALGARWFGEPVRPSQWIAAAVAVVGLSLVVELVPTLAGAGGLDASEAVGLAMCLGGAASYALVVLLVKLAQSPVTARGGDRRAGRASPTGPLVLAWWQCAVGTACLAWWPARHGLPGTPSAWAWLACLGVLNTGLAYALLYAGVARLSAARVAILQFVYPLAAVAVDGLVYGRVLGPVQLCGLGLMLGALFVAAAPPRAPRPDRPSGRRP